MIGAITAIVLEQPCYFHILIGFFYLYIFNLTAGRIYEINTLTWLVASEETLIGRFCLSNCISPIAFGCFTDLRRAYTKTQKYLVAD